MGRCLLDLQDDTAAVERLTKAQELKPDEPEISALLADAYLNLAKLEEATSAYEKVIAGGIGRPRTHFQLAQVYNLQDRHDLVVEQLEKVLAQEPQDSGAMYLMGVATDRHTDGLTLSAGGGSLPLKRVHSQKGLASCSISPELPRPPWF